MATRVERLAFVLTAQEAKLVRGLRNAETAINGLDKSSQRATTNLSKNFLQVEKTIEGVTKRISNGILNVKTALAGLAAGAGAAAPVKFASSFEEALANVDTLLVNAATGIDTYRKQLLELSKASPKSLIDLTQGLYQTISAGIPAVEGAGGAFDVLSKAQKAAVAGLATTETSVRAFTAILNAYKGIVTDASQVSDLLFTTVRVGNTDFTSLANAVGRVATVAAKSGVGLDEMLASIASLTKAGLSTNEAVTALRATILAIIKPTDRARKIFGELGIAIGEDALKNGGLAGVLAAISDATGDSADAIAELIPNVRALVGSLALGSSGAAALKADLEQLRSSTNATDTAYEKIARTFNNTAKIVKSQFEAVMVDVGTRVLPQVQKALADLGNFVIANQTQIGEAFEKFINALLSIGKFIAENGETLITFMVSFFLASRIVAATVALTKFVAGLKVAVATAAAGSAAGAAFATGFQKAVRALPALISGLLRSPSALGLFIGVAAVIGKLIGDAITAEARKAVETAQKELEQVQRRGAEIAKRLGFQNVDEALAAREEVRRGQKLVVGERFSATGTAAPVEALSRFIDEGDTLEEAEDRLRRISDAKQSELRIIADKSAAQIDLLNEQRLRRIKALNSLSNAASATADQIREQIRQDGNQIQNLRDRAAEAQADAKALAAATEGAVETRLRAQVDADFEEARAEAAAKRAKAVAAAARASDEEQSRLQRAEQARLKLIDAAKQAERDLADVRIGASQAAFDQRRAELAAIEQLDRLAIGRRQEAEIQALQAQQASEEEIAYVRERQLREVAQAQVQVANARIEQLSEERRLVRGITAERVRGLEEEAQRAIESAQQERDALVTQFAAGSKQRESIEQATADRIAAIRERLVQQSAQLESEGASQIAEIRGRAAREAAEREVSARAAAIPVSEPVDQGILAALARGQFAQSAAAAGQAFLDILSGAGDVLLAGVDIAAGAFVDAIGGPVADALRAPFEQIQGALASGISELLNLDVASGEALTNAQKAITGAVDGAVELSERLADALPDLIRQAVGAITEALPSIVANVAQAASAALVALGDTIGPLVESAISALIDAVPLIIDGLVAAVPQFIAALLSGVTQILSALPSLVSSVLDGLVSVLASLGEQLAALIGPLVTSVIQGVLGTISTLLEQIPDVIESLIGAVLQAVAGLIASLPEIINALLSELPRLVAALIGFLPRIALGIISAVVNALPLIFEALPEALEELISTAIPTLISAVVSALSGLLSQVFSGDLYDGIIAAIPALISGFAGLIPALLRSLYDGLGDLFDSFGDKIFEFFSGEFFVALGELILNALSSLADAIGEPLKDLGAGIGRFISKTTGLSALDKIIQGELPGISDIPIIGGIVDWFHQGGIARKRNAGLAALGHAAGLPAFQGGGVVSLDKALRQRFNGAFSDDVPALLQEGEVVLKRQAVARLGGATQANKLNAGMMPGRVELLQPVIEARDGAVDTLLRMLVNRWRVEAATPGSGVATTLGGGPLNGIEMVRGRT